MRGVKKRKRKQDNDEVFVGSCPAVKIIVEADHRPWRTTLCHCSPHCIQFILLSKLTKKNILCNVICITLLREYKLYGNQTLTRKNNRKQEIYAFFVDLSHRRNVADCLIVFEMLFVSRFKLLTGNKLYGNQTLKQQMHPFRAASNEYWSFIHLFILLNITLSRWISSCGVG